jgi:hypothetical protein
MKSVHHAPDASSKEAVIGIINATLTSPEASPTPHRASKRPKSRTLSVIAISVQLIG